ncbi:MAG: transposase domain-containing protein [Pirellulaceae bacterium]
MDNNSAERLVKLPTVGRCNYLFVGSPRGGRCAATMYSLVSSAKANGVEPFAWLRELFTRLPYDRGGEAFQQVANDEVVTSTELDYLLPDKWLEQIRHIPGPSITFAVLNAPTNPAGQNVPSDPIPKRFACVQPQCRIIYSCQ